MKTLIISGDYPLPEDRGNRMRTMHFVRAFLQYGAVDLMCYKSHVPKESLITPFTKEFQMELINDENSCNSNMLSNFYRKLRDSKPWIVNSYGDNVLRYVHNVITNEDYDIILCRYSINAYPLLFLADKYKKRVILDMDDLLSSDLYDTVYAKNNDKFKLKAIFDKMVFKKYQVKCFGMGNILFCSNDDKIKMNKYNKHNNMHVVPNIIPEQAIPERYNKNGYAHRNLLFVGSLYYEPNVSGLMWFITQIFNKLNASFYDFTLTVIGKTPNSKLLDICASNDRVELIHNPPDVLPYLEKCFAVIVPIRVGGGTRIKILEAGNCFRPVLSTPLGAHGLGLNDFENVLFFNNKIEFIEKFRWLLIEDNYKNVTRNLNTIVKEKYTKTEFSNAISNILSNMPELHQ